MLTTEQASAHLATLRRVDWHSEATSRVIALEEPLASIGTALIDPEWDVMGGSIPAYGRLLDTGPRVDDLDDLRRLTLMAALHPTLGAMLSRWWVDARQSPYNQQGFRAPGLPSMTVSQRARSLAQMLRLYCPFDADPAWFAAWDVYIGHTVANHILYNSSGGPLFATAIDFGGSSGDDVFNTLVQIVSGTHSTSVFGEHAVAGLLGAARPEGWDLVGRLLLGAHRQEGLRRAIFANVIWAHPKAFERVVDVIIDHDLLRFASVASTVSTWTGVAPDAEDTARLRESLATFRAFLGDGTPVRDLATEDPSVIYPALSSLATRDIIVANLVADPIVASASAKRRQAALRFLAATESGDACRKMLARLDADDLGVATSVHRALDGLIARSWGKTDAFEKLERLVQRLPSRGPVRRGKEQFPRSTVLSTMLDVLGVRPLDRLLPYVADMASDTLAEFASAAEEDTRPLSTPVRAELLSMIASSARASRYALLALERVGVTPEEALQAEHLLATADGEKRRGVITLLARQAPPHALASVERLWTGSDEQRDGASEVLTIIYDHIPGSAELVTRLLADATTEHQRMLLSALGNAAVTMGPGLGLYDPNGRTPPRAPVYRGATPSEDAEAAVRVVASLDELVHTHRDVVVEVETWYHGRSTPMLGNVGNALPSYFLRRADQSKGATGLVLPEVFRPWWSARSPEDQRANAIDALVNAEWVRFGRGRKFSSKETGAWLPVALENVLGTPATKLRYPQVISHVLEWLFVEEIGPETIDVCLDRTESALATVTPEVLATTTIGAEYDHLDAVDWRNDLPVVHWRMLLQGLLNSHRELFTNEQLDRWFTLERWIDEPVAGAGPDPYHDRGHILLLAAFEAGVATDDDIRQRLLTGNASLLIDATARDRTTRFGDHARAFELADEARARIVAIELDRGELPTAATGLAGHLGSIAGAATAIRLLTRLAGSLLVAPALYDADTDDRRVSLLRLLALTHPTDGDTPEALRESAAEAGIDDLRLVDFAVFVPEWARLVETAVGWPGLEDAVSWFDAHSPFEYWEADDDRRAQWASRTTISPHDLNDGAVDVDWFRRAYDSLGEQRWSVVQAVAVGTHARRATGFAATGTGRATLYADALRGIRTEADLLGRITTKRHQDSVRALGLCPLPKATRGRQASVQNRYLTLREFQQSSKSFGNSRQANENKTVRFAIENLARTAGYRDPQRLVWAMEAAEAGDLAKGPVTATDGDVEVTLSIDVEGSPELSFRRGDKPLKSIPSAKRNVPRFVALSDRRKALTKQVSRMRRSLEESMVAAEWFEEGDLNDLLKHPAIAAMLRLTAFVDEGGATMCRAKTGYIDVAGRPCKPKGRIRLAHPVDLLASGQWIEWQTRLFDDATRQPFKQAFRELYVATAPELATEFYSARYEGHQVTPSQAMALFTDRGWFVDRECSDATRLFPQHGYIARVSFSGGSLGRPSVDLPQVHHVSFTNRTTWVPTSIASVPPIVFSEAMRDVDLVVSVAHAGGVDPESTESTIEMRESLVRETVRLARIGNVRLTGSHALIDGSLGEYSVHLGSGIVHRRPGGSICIIPVDTQNRGRVFLPFADPDPKSAEIVSKILLLAQDTQIKDPSILRQLTS
jgi:hypothetical protein